MFSLHEHRKLSLDADIYCARVRSGHPQLLFNDSYEGIRILDCATGTLTELLPFSEPDFSIYTWIVSTDGSLTYLFSPDETDYALELDLESNRCRKIRLEKGFEAPTELGWFTPALHILDYHDMIWVLNGDALVKANADVADRVYTKEYRRITRRFAVVKMDPLGAGLYVRSREYPTKTIGHVSLPDGPSLLMEYDGSAIDVTHHGNSLFIAYDSEILQYQNGKIQPALVATEDFTFLRVNIVLIDGRPYLNVLSSTKDYATLPTGTLSLYELV